MKLTNEEQKFVDKLIEICCRFTEKKNNDLINFENEVESSLKLINFNFNEIIYSPKIFFSQFTLSVLNNSDTTNLTNLLYSAFDNFFAQLKNMSHFKGLKISSKYNVYRNCLLTNI